ncbi:MAG TPA: aminotransferase class V-fold PLP-dependent enzyme [Clostridia bacterium]|nr:aminotransferase class V-fold PLP-dependent enzyme [Clostridia bacterium]
MDTDKLRALFPLTENYTFLNNAAESPLNMAVKNKLDYYLDLALRAPHTKPSVRYQVKKKLAKLLGGNPSDYALMTSTGMGVSIIAAGYKWTKGDNVVLPSNEHWNNSFPWQALEEKGVEVRFVEPDQQNRILPEKIAALTDKKTKIVALAAVSFNTGFRSDLKEISQIAHKQGALFLVDGIQAAGVVPLDVEKDHIDILCCAGFKWLLGLPGTGFVYLNKRAQEKINPLLPGMFAADLYLKELTYHPDARRFETGSIAYSLFYAWTAGLELLMDIGVENIHKKILLLTDLIISGLEEKDIEIITPVEHISERSAIILFTLGSLEKNKALYEKLLAENIILTLRDNLLRISPSFYNTEEEIKSFLSFLA